MVAPRDWPIRNYPLNQCFRQFVIKALAVLSSLAEREQVPERQRVEPVVDDSGYHGTAISTVKNFFSFFRRHEDEIEALSEYRELLRTMVALPQVQEYYRGRISDSTTGKLVEAPDLAPFVAIEFIKPFLTKFLDQRDSFRFDDETFAGLYGKMEGDLCDARKTYRWYSPLHNFSSEEEIIEFGDDLRIRKLTGQDLKRFLAQEMSVSFLPGYELRFLSSLFVIEMEKGHQSGRGVDEAREPFSSVVSALRLHAPGAFGFSVIYQESLNGWDDPRSATRSASSRTHYFGRRYELSKKEVAEVREFWSRWSLLFNKTRSTRFIEIALKRFNYAVEEPDPEDKLIDLVIGLEALYLREKDELAYRLSLRVAILLSSDFSDIDRLRELVRRAYDLRSYAVHGKVVGRAKVQGIDVPLSAMVEELEDILRKSLKRFVGLTAHFDKHEAMIHLLDKAVLDQRARDEIVRMSAELMQG